MKTVVRLALALAGTLAPLAALAHVTLEQPSAAAGSMYKAEFRVGHGCDGSPTRALTVRLPDGVQQAKPMPKAGWTIDVQPGSITWTAASAAAMLPDAHYDEFVLRARLPRRTGTLNFPVLQLCERGQHEWPEVLLQLAPAVTPAPHH